MITNLYSNHKIKIKTRKSKKHPKLLFLAIILPLICWLISTFKFQFMLIQGNSMMPTYHNWQLVLINKHPHNFKTDDVIAFYCPSLDSVLIKRLVAFPSDTIQIIDETLYVNDQIYSGELSNCTFTYAGLIQEPITLSEANYFVLGDNIEHSIDSRYPKVGCISSEDILGKIIPNKTYNFSPK